MVQCNADGTVSFQPGTSLVCTAKTCDALDFMTNPTYGNNMLGVVCLCVYLSHSY